MKSILIDTTLFSCIFFFCTSTLFSQEIQFDLRSTNAHPIEEGNLAKAHTMKDINPGYPSSWIAESDYISTAVSATIDGTDYRVKGENEQLTEKQRSILTSADLGTDINITVRYMSMQKEKVMNFAVTVAPEVEAQFIGGKEALQQYFQKEYYRKITNERLPRNYRDYGSIYD